MYVDVALCMCVGADVCTYMYMFSRLGPRCPSYFVFTCWVWCSGSGFSSPTTSVLYTCIFMYLWTGWIVGGYIIYWVCIQVSLPYLNIPVGRNVIVCRKSLASL